MNKLQDRFWNWATETFVRFGTVLVVAHKMFTTPLKKKEDH